MKLNSDLGESFGIWSVGMDEAVMPHIDMANVACGFHASDPDIMAQTIQRAIKHNVSIGAHPGYDDKKGFGRRSIPHTLDEIKHALTYQVGALIGLCQLYGTSVTYIKPHGALYNDMMVNADIYRAIVEAIAEAKFDLPLMILAKADNQAYQAIADQHQVPLLFEAFADRAYTEDGTLASRQLPGTVYHEPELIINQVKQLVTQGTVTTIDGQTLALQADTVCVHGDNQESINTVYQLRQLIDQCQ
ncbi:MULTISPECIES: 5-oxoprolinase subunit PxpA [unclassified Vibrio]|uniref:5-oxoprolinase subunit PxpA n=1 Tax=Vibrio sp. HB236076 TaxID=3232307 RepID=A0AB39HFB4_9VIBR|nr:5-oxoprolinase subunit PxpA [Vibrio sp. HB161653]MDP5253038.1 5-oxoprolinase subunit PxpA [Vibrio sp. HB161653]